MLELFRVSETETKTDMKPDGMKQEQCVFVCIYMGVHMSGVVCIGKYLNIMEDFVVCLCLESLYVCVFVYAGYQWEEPQKFIKMCHVLNLHLLISMKTRTHTHAHSCTTNLHTLPQVSVCVF